MPACGASFLLILAAVAYGQADHPLSNFKELRMNSQTIKSFDGNNFKQLLTSQSGKASDTCSNISTTDIVFVLDESGSIGDNNFRIAKQFIANLTQYFDIGSGDSQSRVGFVLFQDSAEVIFDLQNYTSNGAVYNAIMNAVYGGGGTNIASGMQAAIDLVFKRSYRPDVNKLMIVLTDGQDTSDVVTQHQRAAALNITTYAIGIGSGEADTFS
uniref:VWFA domain-containing protein n=1 Tax=Plectus sambesii TaxID=2011161 RepID=A0A914VBK2_9BILA